MEQKPSVGRVVHYVSHGTPVRRDGSQAFASVCRTAFITEVDPNESLVLGGPGRVGLMVANPTGLFFHSLADGGCRYDEGAGTPGDPDCPNPHEGGPHRYCSCGWTEPTKRGGTWHWPERV